MDSVSDLSDVSLKEETVTDDKPQWSCWQKTWPQLFFLVFGICNAVVMKVAFIIEAQGLSKWGYHTFQKPWFITTITFFAMFCALPLYVVYSVIKRRKGDTSLIMIHHLTCKQFSEFAIPAFADWFEGIVSAVCVVFVGVSIDSMMKSGTLIGVSLIARWIFKQHYHTWQWISIAGVVVALTMVGASGIINSGESETVTTSKVWVAVIIVLKFVSQVGYAVKISYEEYFVQKKGYHPVMICGVEGFWSFVMCCICMPIAQFLPGEEGNGLREDSLDTFEMIKNEPGLWAIIVISWFLGITYNSISTTLIGRTSAVVRTLMEAFRTFLIWMVQFMIFYSFSSSNDPSLYKYRMAGEQWSRGSYVQLAGFILMSYCLMMYNRIPKYPCFNYGPVHVRGEKEIEDELENRSEVELLENLKSEASTSAEEPSTANQSGSMDENKEEGKTEDENRAEA